MGVNKSPTLTVLPAALSILQQVQDERKGFAGRPATVIPA